MVRGQMLVNYELRPLTEVCCLKSVVKQTIHRLNNYLVSGTIPKV